MKKAINLITKHKIFRLQTKILLVFFIVFISLSCEKKIENKTLKDNHSAKIKQYSDKGDVFYFDNQNDSAFYYYKKGLSLCDPDLNYVDYVYLLSSLAEIYTTHSNYIESEVLLTKTLPYLSKIKKPIYARNVYSYIAYNYYNTYDYNNALLYHRKALKLPGTSYKKAIVLVNIAIVYVSQERYEEAIDLLKPLAARRIIYKREPAESDKLYAQMLDNIGHCYLKLGKTDALQFFTKSLALNIKLKDEFPIIHNYKNLALYYEKTNPILARDFAKKSYLQAYKVNSATNKTNSLALLMRLSEGKELKKYSLDYIKIVDSIIVGRRKSKNQFTTIKYLSKHDKDENLQLKAEKAQYDLQIERQTNRNIMLSIIITLILAIVAFVYLYLTSKGRKGKKEAIHKKETELSRKLHDELANDIYQTMAFVENKDLQLNKNKEEFLNNLESIYLRTRNISKENSVIPTDESYTIALRDMISGFKTSENSLLINGLEDINWNKTDKNKKITVYRALQELLVNMKKHSNATIILINFKKSEKNIIVNYTDNGKGIDIINLTSRNGFHNVESRILAINGQIDIDSAPDKGFKVFIKFPV